MQITRAQWPHTVDDIVKALDGVWGLCGAHGTNGNLYRLERSLHEPVIYTLTEYRGEDERCRQTRRIHSRKPPASNKRICHGSGFC
ncbi:MAG: hypothetical protein IPJ49_14785 [Candidatus Obscuribacter sp.]|nr:hypothetical protein [Candidatus Obscuribacter sp.]